MSEPKIVTWVGEDGRVAVNVEHLGIDVTVFQSNTDNKVSVLVDTGGVDEKDMRVYMNETVLHGSELYDIHDIEKNFSVVFSDEEPTNRKK